MVASSVCYCCRDGMENILTNSILGMNFENVRAQSNSRTIDKIKKKTIIKYKIENTPAKQHRNQNAFTIWNCE